MFPALCSITTVKVTEYVPLFFKKLFCFFRMSTGICQYICVLADLGSVGGREVGMLFQLLSALLAGLFLQHTLHASVYFASCNCSDPMQCPCGWEVT